MTVEPSKTSPSKVRADEVAGKDASALAALARKYRMSGSLGAANEILCAGREAFPDDVSLAVEYAKLATSAADWSTAVLRWKDVLSIDGKGASAIAYIRLAQAYRSQGELRQAIEVARKGLDHHPRSPGLYAELARAFIRFEDWNAANEVLLEALATRAGRKTPGLYSLRAKVMRILGDLDEAEAILQRAAQTRDEAIFNYRPVLEELAEIAMTRGNWSEAEAIWTKIVQVHGAEVPVRRFVRMSRVFGEQFGPDRAESVLTNGIEVHGENVALLEARAQAASARGSWQDAHERWGEVLAAAEGEQQAGAFAGIAQAHRDAGDFSSARRVLQKARKQFPSDARLLAQEAVLENYVSPATRLNLSVSQYPPAEIVVCVYNALEETRACLKALCGRTRGAFQITVVDDASEPHVREFLRTFTDGEPSCRLLVNEENQGYTKSANIGLRAARADWVVLLNSDAVVTDGWLDGLLACALSDPGVRAVGPLSNSATFQSMPEILGQRDEDGSPEDWDKMADKIRDLSLRACPKVPMLNGFCLMLHKPTLDEIGYLDEETFPRGYGEENDLCLRLRVAGYKLAIADWVYVYHKRSSSFSHETRKQLTAGAVTKLRAKWPGYNYQYIGQLIRELPALDYLRTKTS